jgi:hypothetical protein
MTLNLKIWQYDAVNTFINNEIDEKLYNECLNEFFDLIIVESWIKLYTN